MYYLCSKRLSAMLQNFSPMRKLSTRCALPKFFSF